MSGTFDGRPWTTDEEEHLRRHWAARTVKQLGADLDRTPGAVRARGVILCLGQPYSTRPPRLPWSPEEDAYLREHWSTKTIAEISAATGRPVHGVRDRARAIGLGMPLQKDKPEHHRRPWNEYDENQLRWHWGDLTLPQLAKRLQRSIASIRTRAIALNLGAPSRGNVTISAFAERTGYDRRQIDRAVKALGIVVRRTASLYLGPQKDGTTKAYGWTNLTEKQQASIVAYLKTERRKSTAGAWNEPGQKGLMKPPVCFGCQRSDRPHYARGYCKPCFNRLHRRRGGAADEETTSTAGR